MLTLGGIVGGGITTFRTETGNLKTLPSRIRLPCNGNRRAFGLSPIASNSVPWKWNLLR